MWKQSRESSAHHKWLSKERRTPLARDEQLFSVKETSDVQHNAQEVANSLWCGLRIWKCYKVEIDELFTKVSCSDVTFLQRNHKSTLSFLYRKRLKIKQENPHNEKVMRRLNIWPQAPLWGKARNRALHRMTAATGTVPTTPCDVIHRHHPARPSVADFVSCFLILLMMSWRKTPHASVPGSCWFGSDSGSRKGKTQTLKSVVPDLMTQFFSWLCRIFVWYLYFIYGLFPQLLFGFLGYCFVFEFRHHARQQNLHTHCGVWLLGVWSVWGPKWLLEMWRLLWRPRRWVMILCGGWAVAIRIGFREITKTEN